MKPIIGSLFEKISAKIEEKPARQTGGEFSFPLPCVYCNSLAQERYEFTIEQLFSMGFVKVSNGLITQEHHLPECPYPTSMLYKLLNRLHQLKIFRSSLSRD